MRSPRSTRSCSACATSLSRPATTRTTPTRAQRSRPRSTSSTKELTRISGDANFNGINLLDGSNATLTFQVGAGSVAANDQIDVDLARADVSAVATAVGALTFDNAANALTSIAALDTQITAISTARANLGAVQNRFESTIRSLNVSKENLSAASSRITDTDMAEEMVKYTRSNILSQAGTAMLAQANQSGQGVLQLLR